MPEPDPVKVTILGRAGVTLVPVEFAEGKAVFNLGVIAEGDFTQIDVKCSPDPS